MITGIVLVIPDQIHSTCAATAIALAAFMRNTVKLFFLLSSLDGVSFGPLAQPSSFSYNCLITSAYLSH